METCIIKNIDFEPTHQKMSKEIRKIIYWILVALLVDDQRISVKGQNNEKAEG